MDPRHLGLLIVAAGLALVAVGGLVAIGAFSWFGRLPGDIRIDTGNVRISIPLTTMLLLSLALSLIAAIFRRLQ